MKGVQCYELFGGIALKIHTFSCFFFKKKKHLYNPQSSVNDSKKAIKPSPRTNNANDNFKIKNKLINKHHTNKQH